MTSEKPQECLPENQIKEFFNELHGEHWTTGEMLERILMDLFGGLPSIMTFEIMLKIAIHAIN